MDVDTVALRLPDYKFLNDLLSAFDAPLAQTSVNISGQAPLTSVQEIIESFADKDDQPDLIVDAGNLLLGKPSAVIDLTKDKISILRK